MNQSSFVTSSVSSESSIHAAHDSVTEQLEEPTTGLLVLLLYLLPRRHLLFFPGECKSYHVLVSTCTIMITLLQIYHSHLPHSPPVLCSLIIYLKNKINMPRVYMVSKLCSTCLRKKEELVKFFYFNYDISFGLINQDHMLIRVYMQNNLLTGNTTAFSTFPV